MAPERYDRQSIIEGRLRPMLRNPKAAWAEPCVLHDGPKTMKMANALHIRRSDGRRQVTVKLEKFDGRNAAGEFTNKTEIPLDPEDVDALCSYLIAQEALKDLSIGERYLFLDGREIPPHRLSALAKLVAESDLSGEQLSGLKASIMHAAYRSALEELRGLLDHEDVEAVFQSWFEMHPWMFGTSYIGREDPRKIGLHEQVDIILRSVDGYLDIVELKRPSVDVLRYGGGRDMWYWSADASEALGQCANYLRCVDQNHHMLKVEEGLPFIRPRARVVMERSQDWTPEKRDALRTLNAALHGIEIWTYDQVLAMAERLVGCYEPSEDGDGAGPAVGA